jgi:hypothetical protein
MGLEVRALGQEQEEVKEVPKGASPEDLIFEYLKANRGEAYQLFLDLEREVEKAIMRANADVHDKVEAAVILGKILEDVLLLGEPVEVAEGVADYHNDKIDGAISDAVKVLLMAYADLKAGRPLPEVSDSLADFSKELSEALGLFIMGLGQKAKGQVSSA